MENEQGRGITLEQAALNRLSEKTGKLEAEIALLEVQVTYLKQELDARDEKIKELKASDMEDDAE